MTMARKILINNPIEYYLYNMTNCNSSLEGFATHNYLIYFAYLHLSKHDLINIKFMNNIFFDSNKHVTDFYHCDNNNDNNNDKNNNKLYNNYNNYNHYNHIYNNYNYYNYYRDYYTDNHILDFKEIKTTFFLLKIKDIIENKVLIDIIKKIIKPSINLFYQQDKFIYATLEENELNEIKKLDNNINDNNIIEKCIKQNNNYLEIYLELSVYTLMYKDKIYKKIINIINNKLKFNTYDFIHIKAFDFFENIFATHEYYLIILDIIDMLKKYICHFYINHIIDNDSDYRTNYDEYIKKYIYKIKYEYISNFMENNNFINYKIIVVNTFPKAHILKKVIMEFDDKIFSKIDFLSPKTFKLSLFTIYNELKYIFIVNLIMKL
jgi:hypothetical protein